MAENECKNKIKCVSDRGGVYASIDFTDFCK